MKAFLRNDIYEREQKVSHSPLGWARHSLWYLSSHYHKLQHGVQLSATGFALQIDAIVNTCPHEALCAITYSGQHWAMEHFLGTSSAEARRMFITW